jgi:ParB family chromosome partitioning protein
MALVENIHRQDLDAIEIAISYQRLIEEISLTQDELSDKIGKNRTTISNYLRLLKLDPIIQSGIRDGFISMGHGRALININSNQVQLDIYKKIISKNLSVRNTELLVRDLKSGSVKSTKKIKTKFKSSLLSTDVNVTKEKNGKGNFVINFENEIEFNRINKLLNE